MIERIKNHPIIAGFLLLSAIVGAFLTLSAAFDRVIDRLWPVEVLQFTGEICNVSDQSCRDGNLAFAEFLIGKQFKTIDLDLIINTVSVGQFAERCEDEQSLFAQQFAEPSAVFFFPTSDACVDSNVFVLGSTNNLLELDAGMGFSTVKLMGQFTVGEEDAIQGPFGATKLN